MLFLHWLGEHRSDRTQFLSERETAELVRQKADLAATLLASLSHDLKTPLTAIRAAVENLRGTLPPDQREAQADAALVELEDRILERAVRARGAATAGESTSEVRFVFGVRSWF